MGKWGLGVETGWWGLLASPPCLLDLVRSPACSAACQKSPLLLRYEMVAGPLLDAFK